MPREGARSLAVAGFFARERLARRLHASPGRRFDYMTKINKLTAPICYGRCSRVGYVRVFRSGVRHDPGTVMCRICSEIAVRNGDFTETQSE
jgi:hypothetical protein